MRTTKIACCYEIFNSSNQTNILSFIARETGNSTWRYGRLGRKHTTMYNVRSYGINSDFEDSFPILEKLAEPGIDKEAHSYEVTATWDVYPIMPDGSEGA